MLGPSRQIPSISLSNDKSCQILSNPVNLPSISRQIPTSTLGPPRQPSTRQIRQKSSRKIASEAFKCLFFGACRRRSHGPSFGPSERTRSLHFSEDGASTACVVRQFGAHLAPRPPRQIPSMRQFGASARPPSSMPSKRRARSGPFVKCVNASTHRQCTVKSGPVLGTLLSSPCTSIIRSHRRNAYALRLPAACAEYP